MIAQQGAVNTAALIVPGLLVQIVPPQNQTINGVPTNRLGVVGTASWGPVNQASIVGSAPGYARAFGPVMNRKFDMGTQVATAIQQGASDFRCVRVSDGTDVKATIVVLSTCITFTALYSGTVGNGIICTFAAGSKAATTRLTITCPGLQAEIFDNIPGAANVFWVNVAAAVNSGSGQLRGPSQLISATAGVGTTAVSLAAYTLATGTDGVGTITSAVLIGSDSATPRTGMYALRGQGCGLGVLADADDSTQWTVQSAFGLGEGVYMIATAASGLAIANGTTGTVDIKATAGLDSYAVKLMHGDWVYWNDQTNGVMRLVSPQGFVAGRLANLSPEQSSLNKPLYGVAGTQKSGLPGSPLFQVYADADLAVLFQNGIDVITNPQPGGNYWGVRGGLNSSSNASTNGDNYTRMTNFIASTLNAGMGIYVGRLDGVTTWRNARSTILSFLQNMLSLGLLALTPAGGLPFSVVCDSTNNTVALTNVGIMIADVQVQYQAIVKNFIINLEGGQTVTVTHQTVPGGQV